MCNHCGGGNLPHNTHHRQKWSARNAITNSIPHNSDRFQNHKNFELHNKESAMATEYICNSPRQNVIYAASFNETIQLKSQQSSSWEGPIWTGGGVIWGSQIWSPHKMPKFSMTRSDLGGGGIWGSQIWSPYNIPSSPWEGPILVVGVT